MRLFINRNIRRRRQPERQRRSLRTSNQLFASISWPLLPQGENACRPSGTRVLLLAYPTLTSLCDNASYALWGWVISHLHPGLPPWAVFWRRFAAGNYDSLATCGSEFEFSHRLSRAGLFKFRRRGSWIR